MATKPRISKGVNDRVKFKRVEITLFTVFTSTSKQTSKQAKQIENETNLEQQTNKQTKTKMKQNHPTL